MFVRDGGARRAEAERRGALESSRSREDEEGGKREIRGSQQRATCGHRGSLAARAVRRASRSGRRASSSCASPAGRGRHGGLRGILSRAYDKVMRYDVSNRPSAPGA